MNDISKTTDKRRLRGEASRKLILQAAVDSIAENGLGRLTLDRVADRVGISRGLVYDVNTRAVRLYLEKMFPDITLPAMQ